MGQSVATEGGNPLASAATQVANVSHAVAKGDIVLDPEVAERVLHRLGHVREKVDALVKRANNLMTRNELGNNHVAAVMDYRLRVAAYDPDHGGVAPVLKQFQQIVHSYERAVRHSIDHTHRVNEDLARTIRDIEADLRMKEKP